MPSVLIVGATRGLGACVAKQYSEQGYSVYATSRSSRTPDLGPKVNWITNVDLGSESASKALLHGLKGVTLDITILTAGYFATESFDEPNFENEVKMYTISAIAPVFLVSGLVKEGHIKKGGKIIILSSESGSITLRHEKEGGGNFGHHGSKAASNMVVKLLSLDLKDKEIAVGAIHVGHESSCWAFQLTL